MTRTPGQLIDAIVNALPPSLTFDAMRRTPNPKVVDVFINGPGSTVALFTVETDAPQAYINGQLNLLAQQLEAQREDEEARSC